MRTYRGIHNHQKVLLCIQNMEKIWTDGSIFDLQKQDCVREQASYLESMENKVKEQLKMNNETTIHNR